MGYRLKAACLCHTGRVRLNNEDNFYFDGELLPMVNAGTPELLCISRQIAEQVCFGVFDGMSGEKNGEQAAYIAAHIMKEQLNAPAADPGRLLEYVCRSANDRICSTSAKNSGERMGSTAAMLFFYEEDVWMCNIGDSRVYRMRNGELVQLSVDHTGLPIGARKRSPVLTQHLGILPREMLIEPYIVKEAFREGDRYLICSDGLTDMLADDQIASCISTYVCTRDCVDSLVKKALENGGRDNITVIVCNIEVTG